MSEEPGAKYPVLSHLQELQRRLKWAAIAYLIGVGALLNYSDLVFAFVSAPLRAALPHGATLVYLSAPDVFFTYLKIALVLSLFVTAPVTFYQLWAFVAPGLYRHERLVFMRYFLASVALFLAGAAFAYWFVFPMIFKFFLGFSTEYILPMPSVKEYLSLALMLLFAFGICFEIPVLVLLLVRFRLVSPAALAAKRRYVIVWVLVVAAILTPTPDAVTQLMMAVPMLVLFEVGLIIARLGWREEEQAEHG